MAALYVDHKYSPLLTSINFHIWIMVQKSEDTKSNIKLHLWSLRGNQDY